ncbi:MAG: hypothetical protein HYZ53_02105 [Planctomycetes bacterium]|nr:hypothetical protein [Planctomycetota bacterium]
MKFGRSLVPLALLGLLTLAAVQAQDMNPLQQRFQDFGILGDWVYNDFPAGLAQARKEGKPLLVVFR